MKQKFKEHKFNRASLGLLAQVEAILDEFSGYEMTVRQVYYQLVAGGHMENDQKKYVKLVTLITNARDAGIIDWGRIVDRTRRVVSLYHNEDPGQALKDAADQYHLNLWKRQTSYVLVMVEKEALAGVIGKICNDLDLPWTANRGYPSASHSYRAARRIAYWIREQKDIHILHLGDLDPSGWDMTRDIMERLAIYSGTGAEPVAPFEFHDWKFNEDGLMHILHGGQRINVHRIALNMDQVELYQPPPNPVKFKDSRSPFYVNKFGTKSWELDALKPTQLEALITEVVDGIRDIDIWDEDKAEIKKGKEYLNILSTMHQHGTLEALTALGTDTIDALANSDESEIIDALRDYGLME